MMVLGLQATAVTAAATACAGLAAVCLQAGSALHPSTMQPQQAYGPGVSFLQAQGAASGQPASTPAEQRGQLWTPAGCVTL